MLKPSLEEYKLLRVDLAEIRAQITKYMGFIISILGGAGILSRVFFGEVGSAVGVLLVMLFTMMVTTLLFEIIWYKFRSHNRHAGYIQMLSHEIAYAPLPPPHQEQEGQYKAYLDTIVEGYYRNQAGQAMDSGPDFVSRLREVHSWEFVLSRYRRTTGASGNRWLRPLEKSKYAYALGASLRYSDFRDANGEFFNRAATGKVKDYDLSFYEEVVMHMTGRRRVGLLTRLRHGFANIISQQANPAHLYDTKQMKIMDSYRFHGWRYPRKLTQMGGIGMAIMFIFSAYEAAKHHAVGFGAVQFDWLKTFEIGSVLLAMAFMLLLWLGRYCYGVLDLESRYESIDYYCWSFLPFRIQFLNGRGIMPLYFSRDFIRFMKSRRLLHALDAMERQRGDHRCAACQNSVTVEDAFLHKDIALCAGCRDGMSAHYRRHTRFEAKHLMRGHAELVDAVLR